MIRPTECCVWCLPLAVPVVQRLVDVAVLGPSPRHLLHVTLRYQLLQLRDLPHPVEDPPPRHVEDLGRGILTVLLGKQCHLCGKLLNRKYRRMVKFSKI